MGRWLGLAGLIAAVSGGIYYWGRPGGVAVTAAEAPPGPAVAVPGPADVPLITMPAVKNRPVSGPATAPALHDPVLVSPCNVFPVSEQDVSSQLDGVLQEVAVDLGQPVARGQLLARLDDRQVRPQVELLEIRAASRSAELIAKALHDEADSKVKYAEEANRTGLRAVAELEYKTYLHQRQRYAQEMTKAREEQQAAAKELEKVRRVLELHEIRGALGGEVVRVYKRSGEAVKQAEPLFRLAEFDRLRLEGLCKVSQAGLLRAGMRAVVEPEVRGEQMTQLSGHTGTVHGLCVSADGRLVASSSDDRTALVWTWPEGTRRAALAHPAEVYAVAFAAAIDSHRLVTACADGQLRLWSLPARGPAEGPVTLPHLHDRAIRAVAVSADGRWCASGGDDRRVGVWDLTAGRHLYWVQAGDDALATAHQGAVTAVHFTPDGALVTAGRDNVLKVWRLGAGAARFAAQYPGRTGDVTQLGVSPDGRRLLFDHGEELRLLDRTDGTCLGALRGRKQGHFQGVATFSPSSALVLAGASNGRLQLWQAPVGPEEMAFFRRGYCHGFDRAALAQLGEALAARPVPPLAGSEEALRPRLWRLDGEELRHFVTPTETATCAAFAADESVLFTAGTDKVIHVWPVPPRGRADQPLEAVITFVAGQVERGTEMVRVRAEMTNPQGPGRRLRPGTLATLRVYPETAPAAGRDSHHDAGN
jgi:WD40 repeat protein/multidrug efflux pump subunit AcrA (membrane-fusion protein)